MKYYGRTGLLLAMSLMLFAASYALVVDFKDPGSDDSGPGTYKYPTDPVYKPGSFDLLGFTMKPAGQRYDIEVKLNSTLEDPWKTGRGFSVQMIFIFIDTDNKKGSGSTQGLPGLNIQFAPEDAWDRVIILSPQDDSRVKQEIERLDTPRGSVIVGYRTRGAGSTITSSVDRSALGTGDPATWGYQVVVQGNEGFPAGKDLLTRRVNEYEGKHRFGGGNDGDCDPHVLDILAGKGLGTAAEIGSQWKMLAYQCTEDGESKKMATLRMVRK